jgi:hypothetical protein
VITGGDDTYTITETSASGTTFTMERSAAGLVTRTCSLADRGLCRSDRSW